jgi:hypothetical protein
MRASIKTVTLTKGLTLQAEFIVARRSLYQLIYDKADDWLNPKIQRGH